jgi:hypothetical protein
MRRERVRVGKQQMQIGARAVEPVAHESPAGPRAEELHVERLRRLRQRRQPHDHRRLPLHLTPAHDHGLGHATDQRVGLRELVDDLEHPAGVRGVVRRGDQHGESRRRRNQ